MREKEKIILQKELLARFQEITPSLEKVVPNQLKSQIHIQKKIIPKSEIDSLIERNLIIGSDEFKIIKNQPPVAQSFGNLNLVKFNLVSYYDKIK